MKLASFDIFDTTLIRKCGKPGNIFYILAHNLYPNDKAKREDFLLWRKGAESEARSLCENALASGKAFEKFKEWIASQGGNKEWLEKNLVLTDFGG